MVDTIVVIRLLTGDDIIASYLREDEDNLHIYKPLFAKYDHLDGNIIMAPYCPLAEEDYFKIAKSRIEFTALARASVCKYYTRVVTTIESRNHSIDNSMSESRTSDQMYIDGNDTKH